MPRAKAFLWAIFGLAVFTRVVLALRRPLQVDEGYSLHVAGLPLREGLRVLRELDVHPPLFLSLMHFFVSAHVPDVVFRLAMAALGVGSVGILYLMVRLWHGEIAALVAAGCAAVMPSLIFYDTMIRMYAPFDALALAAFAVLSVLYTRATLPAAQRRLLWLTWSLLCAALLYTLYLGFMVIAAQLLYAAIMRREGFVRSVVGAATATALWLPQFPTFLVQLPNGGLAFPFYAQHQMAAFLALVGQSTIAVQTYGGGYVVAWASLIAWLWLVCALALALPKNAGSLCVWLGTPALLTLAYGAAAHKLLYADRYYLLLAYALCALSGVAITRLLAKPALGALPIAWAAGVVLALVGLAYALEPALYTADWPRVGELLSLRARAGDLIVLEQGSPLFVLNRGDSLDHHPIIVVFHRRDVNGVMKLAKPFSRIWLVLFQFGPVDPSGVVVSELARTYQPAGVWEFERALPAETAAVVFFERRK